MHDGGGPYPLDDPVEYLGIMALIEQNVCDVLAKSQSRVSRFLCLFGYCDQVNFPLHNSTPAPGEGAALVKIH